MLKVGDRVISTSNYWVVKGIKGTIIRIDNSGMPYYVSFDIGYNFWVYPSQIALYNREGKQFILDFA